MSEYPKYYIQRKNEEGFFNDEELPGVFKSLDEAMGTMEFHSYAFDIDKKSLRVRKEFLENNHYTMA